MSQQRAELLALVQKNDPQTVVQFVKNVKQAGKDVGDTLAECSQRQKEDVWETLRSLVMEQLLDDDDDHQPADDHTTDQKKREARLAFLDCLVTLGAATLAQHGDVTLPLPQDFVDTATLLHSVLLTLTLPTEAVRHRLAQLFESWWKRGLPDKEHVVANTFLYFLRRSLTKGLVSDVKSVWGLQGVLSLVNLQADSPSASDLRNLLGRCCSSPLYVKSDGGRRFLVFVFTLNCTMVDCLHQAIKNHIPFAPKSWLALYGDIYFKTWQKSSGEVAQKVENDCIQDLMNHAVHASREGAQPMSATLFRVLHQFHRQKKQRGVDGMLLRLYNPILWRSLTMRNTEVRANSAALMLDAFPLLDKDCPQQDCDALIQRQFDLMQRLLSDPCPLVRALTAEGVCGILANYLEMIPGDVVHSLLCPLFKDLAFDTASPTVRLSVIKGVSLMMDSGLCHMLLKPLLPSLSLCLHDKAETVRVAMMELLLKVRAIRSFKYWSISPIEHLLARLAEDSPPMVRRIMELIFPSFLPLDQPPEEQLSRCLTLLQSNPGAARVFFLQAPTHLTLTDTVKYMALLLRYVLENVRSMKRPADKDGDNNDDDENSSSSSSSSGSGRSRRSGGRGRKKRRASRRTKDDDDEEEEKEEEEEEAMTGEILQGLLEAVFLMWTTVSKQLNVEDHSDLSQSIKKKMSVTLPEVLKVTDDPKIISLVIEMAAQLPPKAVPTISQGCVSKLRNMPDSSKEGDHQEILEALCLWQMAPQVLQLLSDWLEDSLTPTQAPAPSSSTAQQTTKNKVKKCVQISAPERERRPSQALSYLTTMLRSRDCKRMLLTNHRPLLVKFNRMLVCVMDLVEKELEGGKGGDCDRRTFLETVLSLHLRLSVLLHSPEEDGSDCVSHMGEVMRWGGRVLVPIMINTDDDNDDDDNNKTADQAPRQLATACVMLMLNVHSHMLMLGLGDKGQITPLLSFCQHVLNNKGVSLAVVDAVLGCLHQAVLFEELDACGPVSASMSTIMVTLNTALHRTNTATPVTDTKTLTSIRTKVQGVVTCVIARHGNNNRGQGQEGRGDDDDDDGAIVTDLTSTMLSAVVAELTHGSRQDILPRKLEDGQENNLPPVTTCVLTCYTRNTTCRTLFMQEMKNCVMSGAITDVHAVHAVVHLLLAIHSKAVYHKDVDLTAVDGSVRTLVHRMTTSTTGDGHTDPDVYKDVMTMVETKMQTIVGNA